MAVRSDSRKVREWELRMARLEESRLSVAGFCRQEGVSAASFYHWRKKFQRAAAASAEADKRSAFTPVRLVGGASVTARLPGGTQVEIPTSDPRVLQLAMEALVQADALRTAGGAPCGR